MPNYVVSSIAFNPQTLDGGATYLTMSDDDAQSAVLPFTFTFYGVDYTTIYIGSNGIVGFDNTNNDVANCCPFNALPHSTPGNNPVAAIFGFFYDWYPPAGGTVGYETFGSPGNQIFVVEWKNVVGYPDRSDYAGAVKNTHQIMLFEADNHIEMHNLHTFNNITYNQVIQGIQNQDGTIADWYDSRNLADLTLDNDAISFDIGIPTIKINVDEIVTTSEAFQVFPGYWSVSVSDSVTTVESAQSFFGSWIINISESITTSESVSAYATFLHYWVGGDGNWDDSSHWSASSGGSGGVTVPVMNEDVLIDTLPGGPQNFPTIKIGSSRNAVCNNLTLAAGTAVNITENGLFGDNITIYGNLDMGFQTGFGSFFSKVTFAATTAGHTVKGFDGFTEPCINWTVFNGVGGEWTLTGNLGNSSAIASQFEPSYRVELIQGSLITNGYHVYCNNFLCSGSLTRSLTLGSSVISVFGDQYTGSAATADFSGTNLTFDAGTSSIELGVIYNNFYETLIYNFIGAGRTFYNVKLNQRSKSSVTNTNLGAINLTGSNTYHNLTVSSIWYYSGSSITSWPMYFNLSENQNVTGIFTITTTPFDVSNDEIRVYMISPTPVTITAATTTLDHVDFKNIVGAGAGSWSGTRIGDQGGNINITFTTPRTMFWIGNQQQWGNFAPWSLSSGGSGGEAIPLPQDDVVFDANSFSANAQQVSCFFPILGNNITFQNLDANPIVTNYGGGGSLTATTTAKTLTVSSTMTFKSVKMVIDTLTFNNSPITITFGFHLNFGENSQFTANTFTANGSSGSLITLTSSATITAALASVSYVAVDHNHALGAGIPFDDRIGGVDNGNNTNWLFPGNIYINYERVVVTDLPFFPYPVSDDASPKFIDLRLKPIMVD